jgi:hypothetical protein
MLRIDPNLRGPLQIEHHLLMHVAAERGCGVGSGRVVTVPSLDRESCGRRPYSISAASQVSYATRYTPTGSGLGAG